jgi:uncharacterized membrane protein
VGRVLAVVLSGLSIVWLAVLLTAPAALASRDPSLTLPAAAAYRTAGRFCHQRPDRSFRVAGVQQPVCARCFGLYAAGALGAMAGWLPARRRASGTGDRWWLAAAAAPTAITWTLEFAGVSQFSNLTRALAALPLGLAAGGIFVRSLRSSAIS